MKKKVFFYGIFLVIPLCCHADEWYTGSYLADMFPDLSLPEWTAKYSANQYTAGSDFTAIEGLKDVGYLQISSSGSTSYRPYYEYSGASWNVIDAFTMEMRLRVIDDTGFSNAIQVLGGNEDRRFILSVNKSTATFGTQSIALDATQWHVYRVTGTNNSGTWNYALNVDYGTDAISYVGSTGSGNRIIFGDTSAIGTTCGGTTQIDYVRWNNQAAVEMPNLEKSFALSGDMQGMQYEYERWKVQDGALKQPVANGFFEHIWMPDNAFGDKMDMTVEFKIDSNAAGTGGAGILYGGQTATNYNWVRYNPKSGKVEWYRSDEVRNANSGMGYLTPDITFDEWHTARVVVDGSLHSVYLDGELLFTKTDATLTDGVIGFFTAQCSASFRNMSVLGNEVQPRDTFEVKHYDYFDVATDGGAGAYEAFPDITRAPNGDLICVFYSGYKHVPSGPDEQLPQGGKISMVRSGDNGLTWSDPITVYDGVTTDDHDPTISCLSDGRLVVSICSYPDHGTHKPYLIWSEDDGKTWGNLQQLDALQPFYQTEVPSGPMLELPDGTLLMTTYGRVYQEDSYTSAVIRKSYDGGQTWTWGPNDVIRSNDPDDPNMFEPSLARMPDGKLILISRPKMFYCESLDNGETWSEVTSMDERGDSPYLFLTSDDILLCGIRYRGDEYGRDRGTDIIYSLDYGETWSNPVLIAPVIGAYTSMVELEDGLILVVYYTEGEGSDIRGVYIRADENGITVLQAIPEPVTVCILVFAVLLNIRSYKSKGTSYNQNIQTGEYHA